MKFRETAWDQQSPPPWSFPGVELRGFALNASMAALEQWCRRMLDDASDSSFVPALPVVFLCLAHYPKMVAEKHANLGYSMQNEYFFMFPVIRRFGVIFPLELGWAYPFMGVDSGTSAISGQMVVGLPKTVGEIDLTEAADGSFSASVEMPALLTHAPTTLQKTRPLIYVNATEMDADTAGMPGGFPGHMLHLPGIAALLEQEADALLDAVPEVASAGFALRQLRDCEAPTQAAFMEVVRMRWRSGNEQDFRLWRGARVDIIDNATFPISTTLGLVGGTPLPAGGTTYTPLAAWGSTFDLSMTATSLPAAPTA
jgi:hypothetical protein